jgi:predicted nucleotidyltransferase
MEGIEEKLNEIKETILKYVPAKYIYLFGSYAYGEPHEYSDIDVYVITPDNVDNFLELYGKIKVDLGRKDIFFIDLLLCRESDYNHRKTRYILERTICDKGKLVYGYI